MGKRKRTNEEIRRKIRRLQCRLDQRASSSDSGKYYESDQSFSSTREIRSVVSMPMDDNPANMETIPQVTHSDGDGVTSQTAVVHMTTPVPQSNEEGPATSEMPALADDILEALGVSKNKVETFAPKIRDEISERWGQIIVNGLSKEAVQKLMENIHIPENFKLLKAPALNTEMATVLSESTKNRDKRLEKAQNHLGLGIAAITNLMSTLIKGEMEQTDIIKKLSEVGQLLLDLHCQNTFARRKLITFSLDKKFLSMIQGVKRDSFLFGENLGDKIKANKNAEKSGLQIKRTFEPQPSTSYGSSRPPVRQGNSRGPPRSQAQRGRRGGPRYPMSSQNQTYKRPPPPTMDRNNTSAKTSNNRPSHKN